MEIYIGEENYKWVGWNNVIYKFKYLFFFCGFILGMVESKKILFFDVSLDFDDDIFKGIYIYF